MVLSNKLIKPSGRGGSEPSRDVVCCVGAIPGSLDYRCMADPFVMECVALLRRTPAVLDSLLRDLPTAWTEATDGPNTWSPYVVIGHLVHAEKADWMPRMKIILHEGTRRPFDPFDREAQFTESLGKPLPVLLDEFAVARASSLQELQALALDDAALAKQGTHPTFGVVSARQLLATWTAHDMAHLLQISRTMARRYRTDVGPWAQFLSVMQ